MRLLFLLAAVTFASESAPQPTPELAALERRATANLSSAERQALRRELDAIISQVPPSAPNLASQARILDKLGDRPASENALATAIAAGNRRFDSNDYAGALVYANAVLALAPSNQRAVALKRMSEGRGTTTSAAPSVAQTHPANGRASPLSTKTVESDLTFTERKRRLPLTIPAVHPESRDLEYVRPGDTKRSTLLRKLDPWINLAYRLGHTPTAEEAIALAEVKKVLESTPSGSRLIASLGGWHEISKSVEIGYAPVFSPRTNAYVVGTGIGASAIVLNTSLLKEAPEVVAPILGHELSHVRDRTSGRFSHELAIPSEFAAHREQIYIAQELTNSLSPERQAILAESNKWDYQRFLNELWKDRIIQRYPSKAAFSAAFESPDQRFRAELAYEDLLLNRAQPGSAHVDYHLTADDTGVYTLLTDEKDILTIVRDRGDRPVSKAQKDHERRLLEWRERMTFEMDTRDEEYRRHNGFVLE